jgi:hypothetical protein
MSKLTDRIRKSDTFVSGLQRIAAIFDGADPQAVKAAVDKHDFAQLCRALKVSEKEIVSRGVNTER